MKAVPMIFNTEMVQALLDGRKTVTRRPMKKQPEDSGDGFDWWPSDYHQSMLRVSNIESVECNNKRQFLKDCISEASPFGSIGDLIYVRETFATLGHHDYQEVSPRDRSEIHEVRFKASERDAVANCSDWEVRGYHWRPSIHMPRWASRLTLKVSDVRIERIQEINDEQAIDEGISRHPSLPAWLSPAGYHTTPIYAYEELWNSIYGNWNNNPYVWVIEFEVIHKNVDQVLREMEANA